ncbi:protein maelstrom-like [Drosophila subpulchrella]|uniref:protein maelstrom-like n=1 Tax=Drosophila subpulchrella TaxID=1486046 RepID=UPI0018A18BC7|nr:protein maelstrom-like [Drosophila subpulchrella]
MLVSICDRMRRKGTGADYSPVSFKQHGSKLLKGNRNPSAVPQPYIYPSVYHQLAGGPTNSQPKQMAPKKRNALMLFVTEWQNNNFEGLKMTIEQAVAHCGEIWKVITTKERVSYNSGAKERNHRMERHESYGQPVSQMQQVKGKVDESENHMNTTIESILMDAQKSQDLEDVRALGPPKSMCPRVLA